jgi:hypothetical protein
VVRCGAVRCGAVRCGTVRARARVCVCACVYGGAEACGARVAVAENGGVSCVRKRVMEAVLELAVSTMPPTPPHTHTHLFVCFDYSSTPLFRAHIKYVSAPHLTAPYHAIGRRPSGRRR